MMKKILLLTAALFLLAQTAHAASDAEKIRAELAEKKAEHAALEKKSKEISREVSGLQTKLVSTAKNIRVTEDKITAIEKELKKLRKQEAVYVESLYKDRHLLGGMVSAARRYSSTPAPQIFVQSKPLDAARASIVMKSVIPTLRTHSKTLEEQLAALEKIENRISNEMASKEKEFDKYHAQEKDISGLLGKRQKLYKETEKARREQEAEVARLAREAKNLDDLVLKIKKRSKSTEKATAGLPSGMITPVSGNVITVYGEKDDNGTRAKGITFATRPSARVVTPLSGKVLFAGPFQKYRQILIVEHKGGYHSLIAGLGRIDTVVGASLAAGEPVGAASGDDASIYYELRRNGDPVDPVTMLAAKKQGKQKT